MSDLEALHAVLSSEDAPDNSMALSDLDGFLTGIVCSPDTIMPSEWLPVALGGSLDWGSEEDVQTIIQRYNEVAAALNSEPPGLEPIFWETSEGNVIAMDWCEGFMIALQLRVDSWEPLMETPEGREWMFPILAHLFDADGKSLVGAPEEELDALLDTAVEAIPTNVGNIFTYWKTQRISSTLQ